MADQEKNRGEKRELQKSYFDVMGLCCSSEAPLIENILKPIDGIKEVSVIVPSRTVIVVHDSLVISQAQIVKVLNQARLEANSRVYGGEKLEKRWPSPWAVASGLFLLLSFLKYVYRPFQYLALGAVAVGAFPIVLKAVASIRFLRLDINILMIIAVMGTIALNDYLEAGTIVFLFSTAEWLESRASHKASAVMSSLMNIAPQKAVIAETGEIVEADEVKVNTILAVKAGEVIPIDGIVVDGTCEVDEKTLTGESFPVPKEKDSTVWAGTINLNGYISVKTTALAEDCAVAKMAKLVEEAQNSKTSTQRLIDKFAKFYTPAVVIISTLIAVIPVVLRVHNQKHWFHFALVVLVSACPCALILSTPVATFCAYTKAATTGLLIKGGDCLETLAKIKIMAFDKTGTITRGEFVVTNFQPLCDDVDLNTLLYWVSSIESKSSHPLAAAIVDYGRSLSIEPKPEKVTEFENFPGEGIHGKIDDRDFYIGNRKIVTRAGSEKVPTLQCDTHGGKTTSYIYSGATPIGIFSLSDACRSGIQEAIGQLKILGIKTSMLTGDSQEAAMQAQEQLGHALELVHAELLPEGKVQMITEFKKEGPIAMVGDGLNDAPALATADIGISMGISGSALASETGNIILMSNDIRKIPKAIKLARKSHRKVIENIILSVLTKAAILGLAFAGHPLVWAAVLADVGTCLLVILNSMLLLRGADKHGGKCCGSSTQLHIHKNGCNANNGKSSHHHQQQQQHQHHHHTHQHCCSDKEKKISQPQRCASQTCASKCHFSPPNSSLVGNAKHPNIIHKNCCSDKAKMISQPQGRATKICATTCQSSPSNSSLIGNAKHANIVHKNCCSDKAKKISQPQGCASQTCATKCQSSPSNTSVVGNAKHARIMESHDQCKASDDIQEPKHCHHGRCEKSEYGVQSHHLENQCCSGSQLMILTAADKCASAIDSHGSCLEHNNSHRTLHCHNRNCDIITHDGASLGSPFLFNFSAQKESQQFSNKHCHLITGCENPKDHEPRKMLRSSYDIEPQNQGPHSDFKRYGEDHISIDIDNEHDESSSMRACESLEEKENGSCCKGCSDKCKEFPVVCARVTSKEREVGACYEGCSNPHFDFKRYGADQISIDMDNKHVESASMHACDSLEEKKSDYCFNGC